MLVACGDLAHIGFDHIEARQYGGVLLILGFGGGDDLLELAAHRCNLVLDGSDRILDAPGVFAGVSRQTADILGDYGKALAELTRARRLDRTVDREHVGLN